MKTLSHDVRVFFFTYTEQIKSVMMKLLEVLSACFCNEKFVKKLFIKTID